MKSKFILSGDLVIFDDKHKLFCGDSTKKESYGFMYEEKAILTITSPPYNIGRDIEAGTTKYLKDDDDKKNDFDYLSLLRKSIGYSMQKSEYVFLNVAHISGNKQSLIEFNYEQKFNFVDTMIWTKTTSLPAMQPNVLNSDFEYIYIYKIDNFNNGNTRLIKIGDDFRGTISNVLHLDRNFKNEYSNIHKALFPLALPKYIVENFSNKNDIILDPFSGLGTTMIACLQLDRVYRGIEYEPYYVEQTIKRFLEYNTKTPPNIKIIRNGKTIYYNEFRDEINDGITSIFDL